MSTLLTARIVEEHAKAAAALPPAGPTAVRRRTALAALTASGLPTSRDENWKYANLRPLERLRFVPAAPARPVAATDLPAAIPGLDRKSTRLNSSHLVISYAVFCLKKK